MVKTLGRDSAVTRRGGLGRMTAAQVAWLLGAVLALGGCGRSHLSDLPFDNPDNRTPTPDGGMPDAGDGGLCTPMDLGSALGTAVASGSSAGATGSLVGSCGGEGPEVAFLWTAPDDDEFTFDTRGSALDTVLYVWSFSETCSSMPLGTASCSDDLTDEGSFNSEVRLSLNAGDALLIVVDSFSVGGDFQLNIFSDGADVEDCANGVDDNADGLIDCLDPLCAEACRRPVECADADLGTAVGDRAWQSTTDGQNNRWAGECGGNSGPDELVLWTAPVTGRYVFDTLGSSFDTVLYALTLDPECNGTPVMGGCNDDILAPEQTASRIELMLEEGTILGLVVDGFGDQSGDYVLNIEAMDLPDTEICDNEIDDNGDGLIDCNDPICLLSGRCEQPGECPGRDLGSALTSVSGTTDGGENILASTCGGSQAPERTFRWTAPSEGNFRIHTQGSAFDTVLSVYSGLSACTDPDVRSLACNDDANELQSEVVFVASEGETFLFVVDGWATNSGAFVLNVERADTGATESSCDDNEDNDGDGLVDCDDSDCRLDMACLPERENDCDNRVDDDGDGAVDCDDSDCDDAEACQEQRETVCDDNEDNDGDGLTDCTDSDCETDDACLPDVELICDDGRDNDGDGFTDCSDGDCSSSAACGPRTETNCTDRLDNDNDGFIDCADLDCRSTAGCLPATETNCRNRRDDDADGLIDCADDDCFAAPACRPRREVVCDNGVDEDRDGAVDCDDSDCDDAEACQPPPACFLQDLGDEVGLRLARGTTVGQENSATGLCGGNFAPDVLLRWTAPNTGTYQFDTFGSQYDTVLYLWRANDTCEQDEIEGACNDDARQGVQSLVTAGFEAGESIYVIVDGWNTSSGNYNLNIAQVNDTPGPTTEDDCFNGLDDDNDGQTDCADNDCNQDCMFP